jgi:hypothetical protein
MAMAEMRLVRGVVSGCDERGLGVVSPRRFVAHDATGEIVIELTCNVITDMGV